MKTFLPLYVVIFLCPLLQAQTTWVVDQNGGGNFTDIQSAINASANGDTISVEPGIYVEDIDFIAKEISVISTGGSVVTRIEPMGLSYAIVILSDNCTFDGFGLAKGLIPNYYGDGIHIPGSATQPINIRNCSFTELSEAIVGSLFEGTINVINCQFYRNDRAIYSTLDSASNVPTFNIQQSLFQETTSEALHLRNADYNLSINDCAFIENDSFLVQLEGSGSSNLNINDCAFLENRNDSGWLIYSSHHSDVSTISNSIFSENYCQYRILEFHGHLEMNGCTFEHNSAGYALIKSGSSLSAAKCVFSDNAMQNESLIYGTNIKIDKCTFAFNASLNSYGPELISGNFYSTEITNSIFWNNFQGGSWTSNVAPFSPLAAVSYSCIQDMSQYGIAGVGCIDSDPVFTNQFGYDFSLLPNSPCIDAGDPSIDLDPDGTTADMGAIYYDQSGSNAPQYTITNLVAGQYADFHISQAGANLPVIIGYSLIGPGPTATPYGAVDMSPPIKTLAALQSDTSGNVSFSPLVPSSASGITLYTQALCGGILSNSLALTTQ